MTRKMSGFYKRFMALITAILLAFSLVAFALTGCSDQAEPESPEKTEQTTGGEAAKPERVPSVAFVNSDVVIEKGTSAVLPVVVANTDQTDVSFRSSDETIVTVSDTGMVTGVAVGTTLVIASMTVNSKTYNAYCNVSVTAASVKIPYVALDKTSLELEAGDIEALTATPVNANDVTIAFKSLDEGVATVNQNGQIVAVGPGTADIRASMEIEGTMYVAICSVKVTATPSVKLSTNKLNINKGLISHLTAVTEHAGDVIVYYTSANPAIATVGVADGRVTAVEEGSTTVTAKITVGGEDYTAVCTVNVLPEFAPTINITTGDLDLIAGDNAAVEVMTTNTQGADIVYSSSATAVATVDAKTGVVTAVGAGEATITVTVTVGDVDYTATCVVTVTAPSVMISPKKLDLELNSSSVVTAVTKNALGATVSYESSDTSVATVDAATGRVTGVAKGTTTVIAKINVNGINYTDACEVTVKDVSFRKSGEFMKGVDISTIISMEEAGVKFRDLDGTEADIFTILKSYGVTTIRVRVWNDPNDVNGNSYGGGHNDAATALEIGKRATAAGLDLLVDFHYSDFWADPGKQTVPKAWASYTLDDKKQALYDFTKATLQSMKSEGVVVCMVQVGNETTNGMCGESNWANIGALMNEGSRAVKEIYPSALVATHFTNPETAGHMMTLAGRLSSNNVNYDVFGTSYYPCWHGSLSNLETVLSDVKRSYNKEVMVLETQYPFTPGDFDGHGNTLSTKLSTANEKYDYSVDGQYHMVKDVMDSVKKIGGAGVFYWEGAQITVGGNNIAVNRPIWEEYGCGWATKYASNYDSSVPAKTGGSPVDNQALFDSNGMPLPSLNVFKLNYDDGESAPIVSMASYSYTIEKDATRNIITSVENGTGTITYSSNNTDVVTVNATTGVATAVGYGNATITATAVVDGRSYTSHCYITVPTPIPPDRYIVNHTFETDGDSVTVPQGWTLNNVTKPEQVGVKQKDSRTGEFAFASWAKAKYEYTLSQTLSNVPAGTYSFTIYVQGATQFESVTTDLYAFVTVNGTQKKTSIDLPEEGVWEEVVVPDITVAAGDTITVGFHVQLKSKGDLWVSIDDAYFE